MEVVACAGVAEHVASRGGVLWVRSTSHRCCGGTMTMLAAATLEPANAGDYARVQCDLPFSVRFLGEHGSPNDLTLELRGIKRKRPVAYWDGCMLRL